tara:strand:+ start:18 stop:317 length:300 start_codon:yes stop_codon:yes gene_type:complete
MARYHNITSATTQELIAPGKGERVSSIALTNVQGTNACDVDLYITKSLEGTFYILKDVTLPVGVTLEHEFSFDNKTDQFGLYIQVTPTTSTPAVDVIIK